MTTCGLQPVSVMQDLSLPLETWLRQIVGEADMPARRVGLSRFSLTGYVATAKAAKAQDAESMLEQDFLTLLEYDRNVDRYLAQPFTIRWSDSGRRRRYTPDVIVKHSFAAHQSDPHLRTTLYEVKPLEVLKRDWHELRPKFRAAIGWAREHGCRFHIMTEREIRTPYLRNVKFLSGYMTKDLREETHSLAVARQTVIKSSLLQLGTTTPKALLEAITADPMMQAELLPWVWNLVNCQRIGVDLTLPLTMQSPIWPIVYVGGVRQA
ncbi:TnsA endonuclease N-terminal domain-containing protein [Klebsiella pneumoniae]|uniref:TnsA endonuclease N-terminal domain-containing protein n=1 Tax=Enterobacteriaceae TaxID=543 RepID=UPI002003D842|nr:TnsA endonuclease N-terminal domain-containing protein [Enterobacter roggenkampii]MCK6844203.1 TnsA endonuclease N-terminal domain-containing protein [Enterobacter roggenkampii]